MVSTSPQPNQGIRTQDATLLGPESKPLFCGLTLESVVPIERHPDLFESLELETADSEPAQEALAYLKSAPFSELACFVFPPKPGRDLSDRLLLPVDQKGFGLGLFIHAMGEVLRLGKPRKLPTEHAAALGQAVAAAMGWSSFTPIQRLPKGESPAPAVKKKSRRKKFDPNDRTRPDLSIYLSILSEAGAPIPTEEEIERTPICELLAKLHAQVITLCPHRLIDLIATGRNGALADYISSNEAHYPHRAIRWKGGEMLEEHTGVDNSAYRQLLCDVVHILVKGGMERVDGEEQQGTDWLAEFDPRVGGIVPWINDKIKVVVLPRLNDLKAGGQIYTNNAAALSDELSNRLRFTDTERNTSPEVKAEKLELVKRYLGKLGNIEAKAQRREALRRIEGLISFYELEQAEFADSLAKAYTALRRKPKPTTPALAVVENITPAPEAQAPVVIPAPAAEPQASAPEPVEPLAPVAVPEPVVAEQAPAVVQPTVRRHRRTVIDPAQLDCFAGMVFEPRQRPVLPPRATPAATTPPPLPRRPSWTKPNPLQGWLASLQESTLATRPYDLAPDPSVNQTAFTPLRKRLVEGSPPSPLLARPRNKAGPLRQPLSLLA